MLATLVAAMSMLLEGTNNSDTLSVPPAQVALTLAERGEVDVISVTCEAAKSRWYLRLWVGYQTTAWSAVSEAIGRVSPGIAAAPPSAPDWRTPAQHRTLGRRC
jgi:hypothetical protein